MKNKKNLAKFSFIEVIIIIIVTGIISFITSGVIIYNNLQRDTNMNFEKIKNDKNIQEFISTYYSINDNYYSKVNKEQLINNAIDSMLDEINDPYTSYIDQNKTKILNEKLNGIYNDLKVCLKKDDDNNLIISKIYNSNNINLKKKDIITYINNNKASDLSNRQIANIIANNQTINLEIKRKQSNIKVDIASKYILMPNVFTDVIKLNDKQIGYLYIELFSDSSYKDFSKSLKELEDKNIESLIIDLRNNTGGYLSSAKKISELFLKEGKVIYTLETKNKQKTYFDETDENRNYDISILVNKSTASSAEILASALHDSYGALLIGEKTYGKGKVQKTQALDNGSMIKYTSSKWYTPNNKYIDQIGLTPDIEIPADNDYDNQLETAINIYK